MKQLSVIKIGASILDNEPVLNQFLDDFVDITGYKILVHGGGAIATAIGKKMGLSAQYAAGRRITDDDTLELITMVYGGLINKRLVASLQARGCNAIGLTGADANLIPAKKRDVKEIDYGWVGDIIQEQIAGRWMEEFISKGAYPVLAPITHNGAGDLLNTNADTIAAAIAKAMSSYFDVTLIYGFEKSGVLADSHKEDSMVRQLNYDEFISGINLGTIHAGMIPKLENAFDCLRHGVKQIRIGKAENIMHLIAGKDGTQIV
jgi:acetylglutamate kinase